MVEHPDLAQLIEDVRSSAKYRQVVPALVARIGAEELAKRPRYKDALKATKNKLHQVAGAYQAGAMLYSTWLESLREAPDLEARKSVCRDAMAAHASTRERLPILETFYAELFAALPPIQSVLDVACGLNPLAVPWMGLAKNTPYLACDVYEDQVAFLGEALPLLGVNGKVEACDVVGQPPDTEVDLAFVLKTLPCLEQVDADASQRLLAGLPARYIIVSYPVASLGGRAKGMSNQYRANFLAMADEQGWQVEELAITGELVFLIKN